MSSKCLINPGIVADHADKILQRGLPPGVTAVQLRLHPEAAPELSVWKKMSTVSLFEVKMGGMK